VTSAGAFDWSAAPLGPGVTVLRTHTGGLAALDKPAGVLSHPNRAADRPRSLLTSAYDAKDECFSWSDPATGEPRQVWLLHRLDSATSGIMLAAARAETAAAVREAFAQRRVTKRYLAVVLGHPRERRAVWQDAMEIQRGARVRAATGGGLQAEAAMRVIRMIPGPPALAVIELEPHTGRTHQLRHQCARRHLPILGDQNYGNFRLNRDLARKFGTDRLFLHAASVQIEITVAGARVRFSAEAPLPEEFQRFVAR
jgi:23S rRNA pseudouridine955/2504/2580 synthase